MYHLRHIPSALFLSLLGFTSLAQQMNTQETMVAQEVNVSTPSRPRILSTQDERDGRAYTIMTEDTAVIQKRLKSLENIMPMTYNDNVQNHIDFFMFRRPSFTKSMLEKKEFYFPIFEKYLAQYNMPDELKYLALIESGLNPKAVSRAKAVGLWQFMTITGKEQGLQINEYIDERMHIEKSTDAACRYLRTLYRMFGDWDLALAAYNSGPGTVRRAIKRANNTNYWEIHQYIPKDTRAYVPQFIAIAYMMNFADHHGIFPEKLLCPIPTKKVQIDGYFDLNVFADLTGISKEQIAFLNPHIKKTQLPSTTCDFALDIPAENFDFVVQNSVAVFDSAGKSPFVPTLLEPESGVLVAQTDIPAETATEIRTVNVRHKVKRGEVLTKIAYRYDVSVNDIKKWNRMSSSKILVGEYLTIKQQKKVSVPTKETKPVLAKKEDTKGLDRTPAFHTVQPGDTLWNISQRYDGLTIDQLKRLNNLNDNTLKVGQKLKISNS